MGGFPGGLVAENPPANGGDMGSIPGLGRSYVLWSNQACVPQLLSLCSQVWGPQQMSPCPTATEAYALQEKPPQ